MSKIIVLAFALLALGTYYWYPEDEIPIDTTIDTVVINKGKRTMEVYSRGALLKVYKISLGRNPEGHKLHQGDMRTPEGTYRIDGKNPSSGFHKNVGISYPNQEDIRRARERGSDPGGDIKIHGLPNGFIGKFHRWLDWTAGCVAVTDDEIDELYGLLRVGTVVIIQP